MCSSDPKRRCAAHTEPVAVATLGVYRKAYPYGAEVNVLAAVEATFYPIHGDREVMVLDPADEWGAPLYEGTPTGAGEVLAGGQYKAFFADGDQRHDEPLTVRVPQRPARVGDRVAHPTLGHGTIRAVSAEFATGPAVQVQWDGPSATWLPSGVPTWEQPDALRHVDVDTAGQVTAIPTGAPGLVVPARRFPDADGAAGEPVYWVTGAELHRLNREARVGAYEEYVSDDADSYLTFDTDVPVRHWPLPGGEERREPLQVREHNGERLFSLAGYAFVEQAPANQQ